MEFIWKRTLWGALLLTAACGSGQESMRGKAHLFKQPFTPEKEKDPSEDAVIQPADRNQAPLTFDQKAMPSLQFSAELDPSELPAGLMNDIFAVHKIDATRTLLFGASKQSWLLDESREGLLTRLTLAVTPPGEDTLFVLENNDFWLLGKTSLGFPSREASPDPLQITLVNIVPDLLKDGALVPRVLYAGPQRLILASEKRANIVLLDGNKASVIALDFPKLKVNGQPVLIRAAGVMKGAESFWFLAQDHLLVLKKNEDKRWRWLVRPWQVQAQSQASQGVPQFALMLEAGDQHSYQYAGRSFEFSDGRLFAQDPLKLSVDIKADPALDPYFSQTIQPLLRTYCTPCHSGYEDFVKVKAKASAYHARIDDGSMPKNMALQPAQIKTLTDYLSTILLGPWSCLQIGQRESAKALNSWNANRGIKLAKPASVSSLRSPTGVPHAVQDAAGLCCPCHDFGPRGPHPRSERFH